MFFSFCSRSNWMPIRLVCICKFSTNNSECAHLWYDGNASKNGKSIPNWNSFNSSCLLIIIVVWNVCFYSFGIKLFFWKMKRFNWYLSTNRVLCSVMFVCIKVFEYIFGSISTTSWWQLFIKFVLLFLCVKIFNLLKFVWLHVFAKLKSIHTVPRSNMIQFFEKNSHCLNWIYFRSC